MNRNNQIKTSTWLTVGAVVIAIFALAYFLSATSPQNSSQGDPLDNMHGGLSAAVNTEQLNALVGSPLPDIQLADVDGRVHAGSEFRGKYTVLFFNEGLMCYPACWDQIASFGGDQRFNSDTVQAISVVTDPAEDWKYAIGKMPELAKSMTMFDNGASASRKLGMLTTASSMHRGSLPGHTYVIIDKDGIVRYVSDDPNMAIANDALFAKIQEISSQ